MPKLKWIVWNVNRRKDRRAGKGKAFELKRDSLIDYHQKDN